MDYQSYSEAKRNVKAKNYTKAADILKKRIKVEPKNYILQIELAKVMYNIPQSKQAAKDNLKKLTSTNKGALAEFELGKIESSEGNIIKAREFIVNR